MTRMKEYPIVLDYPAEPFKNKVTKLLKHIPYFAKDYIASMLPILQWIHRYNLSWLIQDIIAGITVGIVIVPQGMAYAKIASLDPQYGLYTSFVAVTVYCLFGTSKDISMGPISTVSLLVSSAVNSVVIADPNISPAEVAITLSLFAGIVMIGISLLRLGILVDFVPEPVIAGYMTGSAITIVISQWPKLFGLSEVSTHESPYLVFGNTLSNLPYTQLDVAFGLSSLLLLYGIRYICGRLKFTSKRMEKCVFLFNIMRNGLIVVLGTLITFLVYGNQDIVPISIIRSVPAGFDAMGIPSLRFDILSHASSLLPSIVLIMILEHISVAKSFGRIYDYQINPDQEIFAIGISNVVGSFFGGYPSTGAFSRTAIMARSGVRTPLAGIFSGIVVILALYALTPAFYYIPDAVLAAVVIHAVSDLVSGGQYLKDLWSSNFLEFFVWLSAVIVTFFVDVEAGIYVAVGISLIIMLLKFARPPIKVLARFSVLDTLPSNHQLENKAKSTSILLKTESQYLYVDEKDNNFENHLEQLPPGILAIRPCDSILYPNAEYISDAIVDTVKRKTRCGNLDDLHKRDSDRPWNYKSTNVEHSAKNLPVLKALVLDFSAVRRIDATARQALLITRDIVDKYAGCLVEWHFTDLQNQSVRFSLLTAGFGTLEHSDNCSLVSLASAQEHSIPSNRIESMDYHQHSSTLDETDRNFIHDLQADSLSNKGFDIDASAHQNDSSHVNSELLVDKYCCFHWDVDTAIKSICKRLHMNQRKPTVEELKIEALE